MLGFQVNVIIKVPEITQHLARGARHLLEDFPDLDKCISIEFQNRKLSLGSYLSVWIGYSVRLCSEIENIKRIAGKHSIQATLYFV